MPSHPERQDGFRDGILGGTIPPGLTAPGDVERRFAVYRNNVIHSLTEALRMRFPAVERLIGAKLFGAIAAEHARTCPPESPILALYGARFPEALAEVPALAKHGYLPDVAKLEMARGRAYHAADAEPLDAGVIAEAAGKGVEDLALTLHPSVALMPSRWPVVSVWRRTQPGGEARPVTAVPETALVFRVGSDVAIEPLDPSEAAALSSILSGQPLGVALAAGAEADPAFDITPTLARLIGAGLVTGLHRPEAIGETT